MVRYFGPPCITTTLYYANGHHKKWKQLKESGKLINWTLFLMK